MRILFLEPFYGGSHRTFLDGLVRHSRHEIVSLTLPARKWSWRARGAAITFHERMSAIEGNFDLVIASDRLNLATFMAFQRRRLGNTAAACFLHDNLLCQVLRESNEANLQLALNHLSSAMVSDALYFNSDFHRRDFIRDLNVFIERLPDHRPREATITRISERSEVLPLGLDLMELDQWQHSLKYDSPTILWNHRWEVDKDPETFFRALFQLAEERLDFGVVISGEPHREHPRIFDEARHVLGDRIFHYGYVSTRGEYANLLWMSDIVVSTAIQEFFGVSVAEAMYCNCYPILPRRLNFPHLLPAEHHDLHLYEDYEDLLRKLRHAITSPLDTQSISLRHVVAQYDWSKVIGEYDMKFAELAMQSAGSEYRL